MCEGVFEELCEKAVEIAEREELMPVVFLLLDRRTIIIPVPSFRNYEEKVEAFEMVKKGIRELGHKPRAIAIFLEGVEREKGEEFLLALFFSPSQNRCRMWRIRKKGKRRRLREMSRGMELEMERHVDFSDFFYEPNYIV